MFDWDIVPGAFVHMPAQPAWGPGQVQSVIGTKATVNFENQGKVVLNLEAVTLALYDESDGEPDSDAVAPLSR